MKLNFFNNTLSLIFYKVKMIFMKLSLSNLNRAYILPAIAVKESYLTGYLSHNFYIDSSIGEVFTPHGDLSTLVQNVNLMPVKIRDERRGGIQQMLIPFLGNNALLIQELMDQKAFNPARSSDYISQKGRQIFGESVTGSFCGLSRKCRIEGSNSIVLDSSKSIIDRSSSNLLVINSPSAEFKNCSNVVVIGCPGIKLENENNKFYLDNNLFNDQIDAEQLDTLFYDYDYSVSAGLEQVLTEEHIRRMKEGEIIDLDL